MTVRQASSEEEKRTKAKRKEKGLSSSPTGAKKSPRLQYVRNGYVTETVWKVSSMMENRRILLDKRYWPFRWASSRAKEMGMQIERCLQKPNRSTPS